MIIPNYSLRTWLFIIAFWPLVLLAALLEEDE